MNQPQHVIDLCNKLVELREALLVFTTQQQDLTHHLKLKEMTDSLDNIGRIFWEVAKKREKKNKMKKNTEDELSNEKFLEMISDHYEKGVRQCTQAVVVFSLYLHPSPFTAIDDKSRTLRNWRLEQVSKKFEPRFEKIWADMLEYVKEELQQEELEKGN